MRSRVQRPICAAAAACLLVLAGSCATGLKEMRGTPAADVDRTLSPFSHIEEGDLVLLVVGTKAARDRDNSGYVPLEIVVANKGLRQLALTRESFTLIDDEGNRYPVATPRELLAGYEFLDLDRSPILSELPGVVGNKVAAYSRYPSKFSPTRQAVNAGVVQDLVSLPRYGYLYDYIYFPRPADGVRGKRFELFVESQHLETPVFVKFVVR